MTKNNIIKRALLDALGVVAYVALFAWAVHSAHDFFGGAPDNSWLDPILFLTVFIISACITGSLVLLKPILVFMEGQKKEAVQLFGYTVGFLAVIAILVAIILVQIKPNDMSTVTNAPQRCGGNMTNAPVCSTGYHCAPEPGSHLPFGDVGGICVVD